MPLDNTLLIILVGGGRVGEGERTGSKRERDLHSGRQTECSVGKCVEFNLLVYPLFNSYGNPMGGDGN